MSGVCDGLFQMGETAMELVDTAVGSEDPVLVVRIEEEFRMSTARAVADQVMDDHFRFEATEDMQALLGTVTEDILHDQVGNPMGARHGKQEMVGFYEVLFADTEQVDVTPLHRLYGDSFAVDDVLWRGYTRGRPFGLDGPRTLVQFRLMHVFEFRDGLIARENVWIDYPALQAQLSSSESRVGETAAP